MFGWLKGTAEKNPVESARKLARSATIESIFDEGLYSAFMIRLDDDRPAVDQFRDQAAVSAFVEVIEERLAVNDFEPVLEHLQSIGVHPPPDHTTDKAQALRAVVSAKDAPLFRWNR